MKDPPALSPNQLTLLRDSLDALAPHAQDLTRIFYHRLFHRDPSLRLLFRQDMRAQQDKWFQALTMVLRNMHDPRQFVAAARHLGRRHRRYGVHDDDYRLAEDALRWSLERVLGEAFTPELAQAWSAAYRRLAILMQDAAGDDPQSGL